MRIFQASTVYPSYLRRLDSIAREAKSFSERRRLFFADRHGAVHFLKPVLDGSANAFQSTTNDVVLQRMWARERGMPGRSSANEILLSQIEEHRTEVFYCMDPVAHPSDFLKSLPGSVKKTIAWRAAPSAGADFRAYDLVVCNFPSILERYRADGCRVAWFSPAYDPVMGDFARLRSRAIDVIFVGGYTRHHMRRAAFLDAIATLAEECIVSLHLDRSRLTKIADSRLFRMLPLSYYRTPDAIRAVARAPVFGVELYRALGNSKIVINGAIDMAGEDRGNVRCWESLGCGCLMLSDEGKYPPSMVPMDDFITYSSPADAIEKVRYFLGHPEEMQAIAARGHRHLVETYSKDRQYEEFLRLAE